MRKNIFIWFLSGCVLVQSTFAASTMGTPSDEGGDAATVATVSNAGVPMVSVLTEADRQLAAVYPQTYKHHDNLNLPVEIKEILQRLSIEPKGDFVRTAEQRSLVDKILR